LVATDGVVVRKYFVANYMHRVTASEVILREFGSTTGDGAQATVINGALTANVGLSAARAFAGQEIGFFAHFQLEPGWHVYGTPLPKAYTALAVAFDDPKVIRQTFELPDALPAEPQKMEVNAMGETLAVYSGTFEGLGSLLLKFPLEAGEIRLRGQLQFQLCSETVCEPPLTLEFELPLTIEPFLVAVPRK
jgi:thiol:disulfide interchange protein DsbD